MKKLILCISSLVLLPVALAAGSGDLPELKTLNPRANATLRSIRSDIRKSIYVVKSRRPAQEMPDLKFYTYRVKKGDTFWSILSRCSLDIDTLVSVNGFSTAKDIEPGKIIYLPNMRGIIVNGENESAIQEILRKNTIRQEYVFQINRCRNFDKKHLFIPNGKISNLERSLFLGTGFIYPLPRQRTVMRTSGFGLRRDPFDPRHMEFHTGVDISCPRGSEVLAARDGRVVFTGWKGGYGNLVIVEHEHGYRSFYGHLYKPLVRPGDRVKRGAVIALSGNTGRTTGPHLHFEVRRSETAVNPGVIFRN
jgi:murein DD-endopeptidase MepM/ murein hydrolase activator NlpD